MSDDEEDVDTEDAEESEEQDGSDDDDEDDESSEDDDDADTDDDEEDSDDDDDDGDDDDDDSDDGDDDEDESEESDEDDDDGSEADASDDDGNEPSARDAAVDDVTPAPVLISAISADLDAVTTRLRDVFRIDRQHATTESVADPADVPRGGASSLQTPPPPAVEPSTSSDWKHGPSSFSTQFIRSSRRQGSGDRRAPLNSRILPILPQPLTARDLYRYQVMDPSTRPA